MTNRGSSHDPSDATSSAAAKTAQSGLSSASAGIATIAKAIVTLQQAPAAARDQVLTGLSNAQTAMDGITSYVTSCLCRKSIELMRCSIINGSTNKLVTAAVGGAKKLIANTITAGNSVVANCK